MVRSRVELFELIRRDARREEGISIRGLADRYGVHRRTVRQALASAQTLRRAYPEAAETGRTVRQALASAQPPPRKVPARAAPKLGPAKALIDGMLREDLDAPKKQRHTARRVLARLVDEHHVVDVTSSTVQDYVHVRRPQIWAEAGRGVDEAFVPQTHDPGAEAEVDIADLRVMLNGVTTNALSFRLRPARG